MGAGTGAGSTWEVGMPCGAASICSSYVHSKSMFHGLLWGFQRMIYLEHIPLLQYANATMLFKDSFVEVGNLPMLLDLFADFFGQINVYRVWAIVGGTMF